MEFTPLTEEQISELEQQAPEKALRFKGADFYSPGTPVLVLGAGGIGSHVAFLLAKQLQDVTVMDFDVVEPHNIGGQLHSDLFATNYFATNGVFPPKVEALQTLVHELVSQPIHIIPDKFTEESDIDVFTFIGFDNMAGRKLAFEKWCQLENPNKLFIDGRMLADQGMVYAVKPGWEDAYRATLFDDSEVDEGPCTNRASSYCAFFTSSMMVSAFNNHMANLRHGIDLKVVPFKVRFALAMGLIDFEDEPQIQK